jgi:hypothetical protein
MTRLAVPVPTSITNNNGPVTLGSNTVGQTDPSRTFTPSSGVISVGDSDAYALGSSGKYTIMPPSGATAARPSNLSGTLSGFFVDSSLGKVIAAQVWPPNSGNICNWVDPTTGNSV